MSRVCQCDHCGAPTAYLASACVYCGAPLTWTQAPDLRAGALLRRFDFRRGDPYPGADQIPGLQHRPGVGVVVPMPVNRNVFLVAREPRRDVALSLTAVALHPTVSVGLDFRVTQLGQARTAYSLRVTPALRTYRLSRILNTGPSYHVEHLRAPEVVSAVAGVGQPNVLDVRCADSVLVVRVNGLHLGSFIDARYAYGDHGLTVAATHGAGEAILVDMEVREVG